VWINILFKLAPAREEGLKVFGAHTRILRWIDRAPTFTYNPVQIVQQMWNQVGFNVTVNEVQQATIISDFVTGNYQAATVYQFGAVNPDLNYVWWSTTTISPVGQIGLNFPRNSDPQIETAMLTGRHTTDKATRVAAYQTVNERLWVIEDDIREQERRKDFGAEFVRLARAVYFENDERAAIKRRINLKLGSSIVEEKSYADYKA